jgi:serine/threonine-protein kinase RsbW
MGEAVQIVLPATFTYLSVLGACIGEVLQRADGAARRKDLTYNVQLAAHEICANIVEHAYAGQSGGDVHITLALTDSPPGLSIVMRDRGRAFDPTVAPPPDLDRIQERGYGLYLAQTLLDDVRYEPEPGGNCWRLFKRLPTGGNDL